MRRKSPRKPRLHFVGEAFSRLTVIELIPSPRDPEGKQDAGKAVCKCICGTIRTTHLSSLVSGKTKSCGCLKRDVGATLNLTHGQSKTGKRSPEYGVWCNIKTRCYNPKAEERHRYGGRGIRMFPAWKFDFSAFFAYVGKRPSPRHSLDRIDNDGNYEPGNVKWATKEEQARNTSLNRFVLLNGARMTIAEAGKTLNLSGGVICRALDGFPLHSKTHAILSTVTLEECRSGYKKDPNSQREKLGMNIYYNSVCYLPLKALKDWRDLTKYQRECWMRAGEAIK